jgi:putative ATP-dependent endonuclease of OLD family
MYLAELTIENFRKLEKLVLRFQPGLNILVGANNVGKTAVVDSLRALLAGPDEYPLRLYVEDLRVSKKDEPQPSSVTLRYLFRGLSHDDEADFLPALKPGTKGAIEAHIAVRYSEADSSGQLRVKRWCGDLEDVGLTVDMMENLRGVYLPPLRDAAKGLKPSRTSQLSRLMQLLANEPGRDGIGKALEALDAELKKQQPLVETQKAIATRHKAMLGEQLAQALEVGLSASDFQKMSSRVSLLVDALEIEQNGLGFNNLIYMAVVLSELSKSTEAAYRGLIVEEPEAHLHPQLQAVLLRYLQGVHHAAEGERPVQVFVTSHSPNFASIAKIESLSCLVETDKGVDTFFPGEVLFEPGKREKLERYLDITRAELFFARKVIFVEGAAELMLIHVLAQRAGYDLRHHAISVISVEGLNFDSFLSLFGEKALKIPVAVVTDADPESDDLSVLYPAQDAAAVVSDNTNKMLKLQDSLVRVFHGLKTFEYDLAFHAANRNAMIKVLKELHPKIGDEVEKSVASAGSDAAKAKALFCGMFERTSKNVQKGRFGQALAQVFSDPSVPCEVPKYIHDALAHVCKVNEAVS